MGRKGNNRKTPKARPFQERGKEPIAREGSLKQKSPMWQFQLIDTGGPYCWSGMSQGDAADVLEKLKGYESQLWHEIEDRNNHVISYESLSTTAQERLSKLKMDDVPDLFSFRISGAKRVVGIRMGTGIVRLLWWDPNHQVCPAPKKHT